MFRTPGRSSHCRGGGASMELKDYYFILGVPRTATARDILHAYRERAKLYHPDRVGPRGTGTLYRELVAVCRRLCLCAPGSPGWECPPRIADPSPAPLSPVQSTGTPCA